jgi:hypothetical protein
VTAEERILSGIERQAELLEGIAGSLGESRAKGPSSLLVAEMGGCLKVLCDRGIDFDSVTFEVLGRHGEESVIRCRASHKDSDVVWSVEMPPESAAEKCE